MRKEKRINHKQKDTSDIGLDRRKRQSSNRLIITQHFTERTVTPGGDISMQCTASADRPPQFVWERDGIIVSSTTDPRYALGQVMTSDNSVVTQLNITRVRVEDGGFYTCTARENDQVASHENRFDVYGPPYIRSLPPIKVQSGESVNLRCPYYGYPISKIDWEHKGKLLTSSNLFPSRYKRDVRQKARRSAPSANINGILSIPEISKEQNGAVYTCIVTSPSGEMARRAFEIQVIEAPVLDDLLLGSNLQEGQIVNIYCNVRTGDLPIHFEWLKDGKRVPSSLKVVERNSELFSALVIKKVSLEHCGTYTCVASNHVAKVNRSTDLYIKVAPKWIDEPSNSSLLLGRRGAVSCSASGYPQPQVHWMKKDALLGTWQPVLELAGGGILSLPNGTLIIEEVSLTDEGLYSCNVENGVGQPLSKTIWMSVNKPVHFDTSTTNKTSQLGHSVTLSCHPLGDDPIRVTWTHDGNSIEYQNQRLKLSETNTPLGLTSVITIQYSEIGDAGLYQCRASNPYGASSFNVHLTILEPPTPPLDVRIDSVHSRSAVISWRDSLRAHARHYTLQYSNEHYVHGWDHAISINVSRKDTDIRQSVNLQNLRPATAYTVRVASGNQVEVSQFTAPVHFTTHEEAPSSPPISVQVEQTENPGELYITWLPPLKEAHNGAIIGYHVKTVAQNVGSEDTDSRTLKVSQLSGKQETLVSGLLKNTRYAVSVSAYTSAGAGPFSLPVFQDTREGAPEQAPSSVECTAVSSTSLRVGWQPIVVPGQGSSLVGYTVLYTTEAEELWGNQTSLHTETYLQGLQKYRNYTIKVAGFSNFGIGPYSYPIICATLQDVPGPPADIKVLVLSSSSLLVSWKKPEHANGELLYYTVYIKPTSSNGPAQTYRVEGEGRTTVELKELTPGRTYEVWATAATSAGEGSATRRVSHTPTHRVVAGVASLGGVISVGVGSSLLLVCQCVGAPPPRTVWYHKQNIITHHPRFTRNHDDSLLINNIDQSLSGNYTCLAKNLYGSDSVEYTVIVLPLPEAPILRATPYKDSILVEWEQPYHITNRSSSQKISYSLTWKESNGPWQEAWQANKLPNLSGVQKHALTGLKCGTKYSLRITATNKVGTSQPAYMDVNTLGGVPISPTTNEWLWSNCSHIYVQLAGWDDGGCELRTWDVEYRQLGTRAWVRAHNTLSFTDVPSWSIPTLYQTKSYRTGSFAIGDLLPGTWYQVKVTATNEAGSVTNTYNFATKNEDGSEIGPPAEFFDLNMLVIVCSSILLTICLLSCIYILVKRQRGGNFTEYRDSIAVDNKSESGNVTANTSHTNLASVKDSSVNTQNRIYSAPIHMMNNSKHELYEISPYAQFAVGFRTFGHVENQDLPSRHNKQRYDTETSFQVCSESEDSDSLSKSTLKSVPRKVRRTPHHR